MKQKDLRRHFLWKAVVFIIAAFLLSSCGGSTDEGSQMVDNGRPSDDASEKTLSYEGTWYEQSANASVLIIKGSKLTYQHGDYSDKTRFTAEEKGDSVEFKLKEEFFSIIDISYEKETDQILGHTMPHTDGDGGYHLLTYARTPYVAPPPPVYGERIDHSDPDAAKEISDYSIRELKYEVYEPWVSYGDMNMEPPQEGQYCYELTVGEDGRGSLSSDFCKTITIREKK